MRAEKSRQDTIDRVRAAGAWAVVLAMMLAARHFEYTGLLGWWLR